MMRSTWRVPRAQDMRWIVFGIVLFALLMAILVALLRIVGMKPGDSGQQTNGCCPRAATFAPHSCRLRWG